MPNLTSPLNKLIVELPAHLRERTSIRSQGEWNTNLSQVVYWTHHALRTDENPALDVAICLANATQSPLLVYQGLSERYRFASDRHHTFILEAAVELQEAYAARGIEYALHVERRGARFPVLAKLLLSAKILVTEDFPIEATAEWTAKFASSTNVPIVLVDTACVVPMQLVGKCYDRAFAFRNATERYYKERVSRGWPAVDRSVKRGNAPFRTLRVSHPEIPDLVAECEIDHSIGPVSDTRGGAKAGYSRWEEFCKKGLSQYAKRRNAIEMDGVSRMSAYLHYGMVSPMRIAREASAFRAEKYLDELLIWRELAYCFCKYRPDIETEAAIPKWAVETLSQHQKDPRNILSWETLARGRSGQPLWDAAQRSLIKHGELHNNVRMTWGKALLEWSNSPSQTLERLIDLNHRFALDGRDPASYGGILWCLGQFDRPFFPEQPVLGSVRSRPLAEHQARTNLSAYQQRVDRPPYQFGHKVAIVGCGLAGLMCGRILTDHGIDVTLFDKSHRPGGRSATRSDASGTKFDHGAQYFTIRDLRLKPFIDSWLHDGLADLWKGRIVTIADSRLTPKQDEERRYVGVPSMESIASHLAQDLSIQYQTQVARAHRIGERYRLETNDGRFLEPFDTVLWNCPPKQIANQAPEVCSWYQKLSQVVMTPCWAVMLAMSSRWEVPFDGAFVNGGPIAWMARNSSKPGRKDHLDTWVVHTTSDWAVQHLDSSKEQVIDLIVDACQTVTGSQLPQRVVANAHRWLFARPDQPLQQDALWDPLRQLGACGDWCGGPRVEGALKSGMALAGRVMGHLHQQTSPTAPVGGHSARQLELF